MADPRHQDTFAVIRDLERRLAPDDPLRCVTNALRECADRLTHHTVKGDTEAQPIVWSRFIALGNVEGRPHPCYGIYPGIADDEDVSEIERIGEILKRRKVSMITVESVAPLKETGTLTAALALYGEDKDGDLVFVICRHPDVTLPQANCLLLAAVMEATSARLGQN